MFKVCFFLRALFVYQILLCCSSAIAGSDENNLNEDRSEKNNDGLNFLSDDEFVFDADENFNSQRSGWLDLFKLSLQHDHTESDTVFARSALRVQYERVVGSDFYVFLDNKINHFRSNDNQSRRAGGNFVENELQQAWIQYTNKKCALKAGLQNLIWGEIEGVYATDVVTPIDNTEQLLTDFSNVRLAQNMLLVDCFGDEVQYQLFYISNAKADRFFHRNDIDSGDAGAEWGARFSFNLQKGTQIKLMAARLYSNTPQLITVDQGQGIQLDISEYELYGVGASFVAGRTLLELDLAYKKDQLLFFSADKSDLVDIAVGFEYSTASGQQFNGSVWHREYIESNLTATNRTNWAINWSRSFLNDNLSMSALLNGTLQTETLSTTVLAQYSTNDHWQYSLAFTASNGQTFNNTDAFFTEDFESFDSELIDLLSLPERLLSLSIRYQF